jgi:Tol biopolymer transport system component
VPASEVIPFTKTFTPDGRFVYYLASAKVDEPGSLYRVATLGGPVTKILDGIYSGVSFSPDGQRMVFFRNDKDGARYVISSSEGSEETLLYRSTPGFGSSAWSPDGKLIAIALQADAEKYSGGCTLAVVKPDTGEMTPISNEIWTACGRMEWSPDSRGFYMIGTRKGEIMTTRRDQIYHISYPQGRSRKITSDGSRYQHMSLGVTTDGAIIAVPYNRSSQIWVMDQNGETRSAFQITTGQNDGRSGIAPMADGRVAYISRIAESIDVWVMNQDGSGQKPITENSYPIEEIRSGGDGRYLVFAGYPDASGPQLFRMNTDGNDVVQLTFGSSHAIDSSLSHDGKWIAYASGTVLADHVELSLWKQSLDTGERVSLNRNDCEMPHFSPDDLYLSCVRQQKDILILSSADGSLIKTFSVPQSAAMNHTLNFGARWTPDGKAVAYVVNSKGVSNIWIRPIDGSPPKQLTDFSGGSIYHFASSLDGKRLFVARGYQIRDAVLLQQRN